MEGLGADGGAHDRRAGVAAGGGGVFLVVEVGVGGMEVVVVEMEVEEVEENKVGEAEMEEAEMGEAATAEEEEEEKMPAVGDSHFEIQRLERKNRRKQQSPKSTMANPYKSTISSLHSKKAPLRSPCIRIHFEHLKSTQANKKEGKENIQI